MQSFAWLLNSNGTEIECIIFQRKTERKLFYVLYCILVKPYPHHIHTCISKCVIGRPRWYGTQQTFSINVVTHCSTAYFVHGGSDLYAYAYIATACMHHSVPEMFTYTCAPPVNAPVNALVISTHALVAYTQTHTCTLIYCIQITY